MDRFKTKPGIDESIPITDADYENATHRQSPYVQRGEKGNRYFAVCPMCDNPIQLIGFYKKEKDANNPYGRHYGSSIRGLAIYDKIDYLNCPYSNPSYQYNNTKRDKADPKAQKFYQTMREKFDRIIYLLSKMSGMYISQGFAKELLESWILSEGWRYYQTTYFNLPFSLIWAEPARTMFGRLIDKESELHQALFKKGQNFSFTDARKGYVQIGQKDYLDATFYFGDHKSRVIEEHLYETISLCVTENGKLLHKQIIIIDNDYTCRVLAMSNWQKDQRLLKIAADLMK
ncbi:MAG: hypothetical protein LUE23_08925 [Lachnospiraceae bacterium]|nr:hypothetical protein [Lachnospiraceae bacterium]